MDYQLQLKQIVDYPRCRIYREFLRTLMQDRDIRTAGCSYLFYYAILCSDANFRSSYRKLEGISFLIEPGEWICRTSELSEWFRVRFKHQALAILDDLARQQMITYSRLGRGNLVKFSICDWKKHNTALEYNYPCLKDVGFFFLPVAKVYELISLGRCSEMDIVLDLWVHAIYNDEQVEGSELGPVVYFRNHTGNPVVNYADLALRWGISKATVCRILKKLQEKQYLNLISFTGRHGSIIYLQNYLSTMLQISDVMIDKEEVSMKFQIPVQTNSSGESSRKSIRNEQIVISDFSDSVSELTPSVSKSDMKAIIEKITQILSTQGISCCECPKTIYKLYPLSDCRESNLVYSLEIGCSGRDPSYRFELTITPVSPT